MAAEEEYGLKEKQLGNPLNEIKNLYCWSLISEHHELKLLSPDVCTMYKHTRRTHIHQPSQDNYLCVYTLCNCIQLPYFFLLVAFNKKVAAYSPLFTSEMKNVQSNKKKKTRFPPIPYTQWSDILFCSSLQFQIYGLNSHFKFPLKCFNICCLSMKLWQYVCCLFKYTEVGMFIFGGSVVTFILFFHYFFFVLLLCCNSAQSVSP